MNEKTRTPAYREGGPIVRFDKVGVTYGSGTQALRNVSFELESGGFYSTRHNISLGRGVAVLK